MLSLVLAMLVSPAHAEPDFNGIVALPGCSGAVFHFADQPAEDDALVLTNGHCLGRFAPFEVYAEVPYETEAIVYDADMRQVLTVDTTDLVYATMHETDMAVLRLPVTYRELAEDYGVDSLLLDDERGVVGEEIAVVSGLWEYVTTCALDGFVHAMVEGDWSWTDSIRMTQACETFGGTSGSPILSVATNQIIGVNNTGYEGGEWCTVNNPCEVDADGNISVIEDGSYGQQTLHLYSCIDADFALDLDRPDCALPVPRGALVIGDVSLSTDDACDGDGVLDGGESGTLTVELVNEGAVDLVDTWLDVVVDEPAIELDASGIAVDALAPGAATTVSLPLSLAGSVADLTQVRFSLRATDPDAAVTEVEATHIARVHFDPLARGSRSDDVEGAATAWTVEGGLDNIARRTDEAGNTAWHLPDAGEPGDVRLVSPPLVVGLEPFALSLDHRYHFESSGGVHYDGGVIEFSTDEGETWSDVSAVADVPYAGVITDESGNVLANRGALVGASPDWPETTSLTLDFGTELAGRAVQLRFRVGTDAAVGDEGWEIDDIATTGLLNRPFTAIGPHDDSCGTAPVVDDEEEAAVACGCTTARPVGMSWLVLPLALALVRRRE